MKIALEHLDARGLTVDLPGTRDERVVIASASALRGTMTRGADTLELSDVSAKDVVLASLALQLGSVRLTAAEGATFSDLTLQLAQSPAGTVVSVTGTVDTPMLSIETPTVSVRGRARMLGVRLGVHPGSGTLTAQRVLLSAVELRVGGVTVTVPDLVWEDFSMGWGDVFRLEASALATATLDVATAMVSAQLRDVRIETFALVDGDVSVGRARVGRGSVAAQIPPAAEPSEDDEASGPSAVSALLDWALLDGVSGQLDVDAAVDVTVPVIGSRKATHRLRVPLQHGALDYMALENNLSPLENSLLDFAVRDTGLVLERGIPLLPTRGRGKPIVVWDLDGDDLTLAQAYRIRLAVLPRGRLAKEASEPAPDAPPAGPSPIALRHLALHGIDVALSLAPPRAPLDAGIRTLQWERLTLKGQLTHDPGQSPRPGQLQGTLEGLAGQLRGVALGGRRLDLEGVALATLEGLEVAFAGLRPTTVQAGIGGLIVDRLALTAAENLPATATPVGSPRPSLAP